MKLRDCCLLSMLVLPATLANAGEVTVAVASNFTVPLNAIATAFENETGHKIKPAFGSSGKLYAQIRNGAPFDVFLSADRDKPLQLERDGFAIAGSRFTYATGALVLWSSKPGFVDRQATVLKELRFNRLAIANPVFAPYGAAAVEVLQHFGIAETSQLKLVRGENIAQTYQFVHSGNADLGLVALSQIIGQKKTTRGSAWVVPVDVYGPIRQDAVLLQPGANNAAARALLRFLRGDPARAIIRSHGYSTEPD